MAAAAAAYPPWVIFDKNCTLEVQGGSSIAYTNTVARCSTSTGHPIHVSLCLAAPPAGSRVCVHLPRGTVAASYSALVVAAHGDSVLLMVRGNNHNDAICGTAETGPVDLFVYSTGDAAAEPPRPPSLSLLRPHSIPYEDERRPGCHVLNNYSTGLLRRRGGGDFLVAELKMQRVTGSDGTVHDEAALHLLRSASSEWRVEQQVVISGNADADAGEFVVEDLASTWQNSKVIPVGDQMLCWVDSERGLLFSDDVLGESPSLRYVPFPFEADLGPRSVFATADGSTIVVVNNFPRCCCGGGAGAGKSKRRASHIHTWTMRVDDLDMAWVMDGSLDSSQLWDLDAYQGIPCVELDSPVVSMDEPDAICFMVCERDDDFGGDGTMWRIIVDMKNKTLRSVFRSPKAEGRRFTSYYGEDGYLPSSLQILQI